jgi:succinate dehydrogenase / fumarate reductase membrane anchor subunit
MSTWLLFPVVAFGLWHTFSGFKMITDDYVSCRALRFVLLVLYWGIGVALFALGLANSF